VRSDRNDVRADETNLVIDAGILAFIQWCERRGVFKLIDLRLPLPGTNGYTASDMIKALWAAVLTRKGRVVLAVTDELCTNDGMRGILRLRRMPWAAAVADWLRRLAGVELRHAHGAPCRGGVADGLVRIQNLFYELTGQCLKVLQTWLHRVLNFDAMVMPEEKKYAEWAHDKQCGTMAILTSARVFCKLLATR